MKLIKIHQYQEEEERVVSQSQNTCWQNMMSEAHIQEEEKVVSQRLSLVSFLANTITIHWVIMYTHHFSWKATKTNVYESLCNKKEKKNETL